MYWQNVHDYSPIRNGLTMLPMVTTMMIFSPISGSMVNRIGTSKLITCGMLIVGVSAFLYLQTGVSASFLDVLPAMIVMGFGFSLIFAPMTTAVLNSVESDKSGIASAVNGAVRETGFAFGVALLGTIMNQVYKARFDSSSEVQGLRDPANTGLVPLQPVIDTIGDGINNAGHVIHNERYFPGIPDELADTLYLVSSRAFVDGMHRSFIITGLAIMAVAIMSFVLVRDSVAETPADEPEVAIGVAPAVAPGE